MKFATHVVQPIESALNLCCGGYEALVGQFKEAGTPLAHPICSTVPDLSTSNRAAPHSKSAQFPILLRYCPRRHAAGWNACGLMVNILVLVLPQLARTSQWCACLGSRCRGASTCRSLPASTTSRCHPHTVHISLSSCSRASQVVTT